MNDLRMDEDLAALLAFGDDAPPWLLLRVQADRANSSGLYTSLRLHTVAYAGMPSASQQAAEDDVPRQAVSSTVGETVVARVNQHDAETQALPRQMEISNLCGETIADIDMSSAETLHAMKSAIQRQTGIPVAEQRLLIGNDEVIEDGLLKRRSDEHFLEVTLVRDATGQQKELRSEAQRCFFEPPSEPGRRSARMPGYALWRSCTDTDTSWQLATAVPDKASVRLKIMVRQFASSVKAKLEDALKLQCPIVLNDECEELSELEELMFKDAEIC